MANTSPRPVIEQTFFSSAIAVGVAASPIVQQLTLSNMIDTFILSNPSTNANSVFVGDQGVTLTSGLEITIGSGVVFRIAQTRQLYEVQDPSLIAAQIAACQPMDGVMIPVVVWNPSNFYIIAAAPTTIGAMFFRNVYV